jgi:hypothetical protein
VDGRTCHLPAELRSLVVKSRQRAFMYVTYTVGLIKWDRFLFFAGLRSL